MQVESDLTDFPVLISISDSDLRDKALQSGDDILFTLSDGLTKLSHEIERYDSVSGNLIAWVKIPSLPSSPDTEIYMYYGNSGANNQENVPDVWSNGYEAVYHLHENILDSAGGHDGTNSGTSDIEGKIGDGRDFTPVSYLSLGQWSVSGDKLTMQSWSNFDDFDQDDPRIISKAVSEAVQDHAYTLSLRDRFGFGFLMKYLKLSIKTGTSDSDGTTELADTANPLTAGVWHFTVGVYDGSFMRIYKDGDQIASLGKTGSLRENSWEIQAGNNPNNINVNQYSMDGKLDEIRISSAARSSEWLKTEYNNQNSPSSFYSIGVEESW